MAWVKPQAEIEAALRDHPVVVAGVREVAEALLGTAKALARVRAYQSGEYFQMILIVDRPGGGLSVVATAKHSWFVEVGTGIFGPFRRPVLAEETTASGHFKFVVLESGSPSTVYTDRQKGRPARHVMRDAAVQVAELPGLTWTPMLA